MGITLFYFFSALTTLWQQFGEYAYGGITGLTGKKTNPAVLMEEAKKVTRACDKN